MPSGYFYSGFYYFTTFVLLELLFYICKNISAKEKVKGKWGIYNKFAI